MDIQKLNIKKQSEGFLTIKVNGKNRKYHLTEIASSEVYSLYLCKYYRFFYISDTTESSFEVLFKNLTWTKYTYDLIPFPFSLRGNSRGITDMCITILYKDGEVDKILDHNETVDYFDSLCLMNRLGGNVI